jgi:hypothetical protein
VPIGRGTLRVATAAGLLGTARGTLDASLLSAAGAFAGSLLGPDTLLAEVNAAWEATVGAGR